MGPAALTFACLEWGASGGHGEKQCESGCGDVHIPHGAAGEGRAVPGEVIARSEVRTLPGGTSFSTSKSKPENYVELISMEGPILGYTNACID